MEKNPFSRPMSTHPIPETLLPALAKRTDQHSPAAGAAYTDFTPTCGHPPGSGHRRPLPGVTLGCPGQAAGSLFQLHIGRRYLCVPTPHALSLLQTTAQAIVNNVCFSLLCSFHTQRKPRAWRLWVDLLSRLNVDPLGLFHPVAAQLCCRAISSRLPSSV